MELYTFQARVQMQNKWASAPVPRGYTISGTAPMMKTGQISSALFNGLFS